MRRVLYKIHNTYISESMVCYCGNSREWHITEYNKDINHDQSEQKLHLLRGMLYGKI